MIAHWKKELAAVLPDKPDLIVLPETCDCFTRHNQEESHAYLKVRRSQIRDFIAKFALENKCYLTYPANRLLPDWDRQRGPRMRGA